MVRWLLVSLILVFLGGKMTDSGLGIGVVGLGGCVSFGGIKWCRVGGRVVPGIASVVGGGGGSGWVWGLSVLNRLNSIGVVSLLLKVLGIGALLGWFT